jgi:hypothetical protein
MRHVAVAVLVTLAASAASVLSAGPAPSRKKIALAGKANADKDCLRAVSEAFTTAAAALKRVVVVRTAREAEIVVTVAACDTTTTADTHGTAEVRASAGASRGVAGNLTALTTLSTTAKIALAVGQDAAARTFTSGPDRLPLDEAASKTAAGALAWIDSLP